MPVAVASRHSHLQNTRTSRSPVSPNARNNTSGINPTDKQPTQNVRETESIFDDVNGSFAFENVENANPLEFINAEEKLQNLAI